MDEAGNERVIAREAARAARRLWQELEAGMGRQMARLVAVDLMIEVIALAGKDQGGQAR